MSKEWKYGNIQFESDQFSDTLLRYAPWSGHRQFGYDLVTYYQPDCMVELGSHYGCSAFTFMQAIKDNNYNTKICAVDLWEASDIYTKYDYERDIYGFFRLVYEKCFTDLNVEIMKMSFDQANKEFDDCSIDIIHIDGSHEYDDVKHDYELWLPKMKENGIMMFHDISDQKVLGDIMGSHIFWNEIKERYSTTAELKYSWGLGILFLSKDMYQEFIEKVDLGYYLKLNMYEESLCKDRIRRDYFRHVDDNKWIESLKNDISTLNKERQKLLDEIETIKNDYEVTGTEKENYIQELKQTINRYKNQNEKIQHDYEVTVSEKEKYIQELQQTVDSYKKQNEEIQHDYEVTVSKKEKYIQEQQQTIDNYKKHNEEIQHDYEVTVSKKEKYIQEQQQTIDSYKKQNEGIQHDYEVTVSEKEKYIQELQQTVDSYKKQNEEIQHNYEATVSDKEKYIQELQQTVESYKKQNEEIQHDYEATVSDKEKYIRELQQTVESYKKQNEEIQHDYEITISEKDVYIQELQKTIEGYMCQNEKLQRDYEETIAGKEKYINELLQTLDTLNKYEKSTN